MAKKYEEIADDIEKKVSQFVDTFSREELEHALQALGAPSDIRQLLVDTAAEKLVIKKGRRLEPDSLELVDDLDTLLIVALSPARIKKVAAEKILACKDDSNRRHLNNLLRFASIANIDSEVVEVANKITDDRFFAGTDIRERFSKAEK